MLVSHRERKNMAHVFDKKDDSIQITDVLEKLKTKGYTKSQCRIIVRECLQIGLLYVDDITDQGVYIALTEYGEEMWKM